jgi:hypothetical protein
VHFRAPPDVRGSGKERGHGAELKLCPKCGRDLKPGKHHVGCCAGKRGPPPSEHDDNARQVKEDEEKEGEGEEGLYSEEDAAAAALQRMANAADGQIGGGLAHGAEWLDTRRSRRPQRAVAMAAAAAWRAASPTEEPSSVAAESEAPESSGVRKRKSSCEDASTGSRAGTDSEPTARVVGANANTGAFDLRRQLEASRSREWNLQRELHSARAAAAASEDAKQRLQQQLDAVYQALIMAPAACPGLGSPGTLTPYG